MRVEQLQATFDIDVAYRHFPLHPETPEEGLTLEALFAGRDIDIPAVQNRIADLMAEEGLPYGTRTMTYNSRLAQELAAWADILPDGHKIHDALFRAYFVDNVNLAMSSNLVEIVERIGLPGATAHRVLEQRQFRQAVDDDWQRSRALGITAVPTFIVADRGLVGAQPYEQLHSLVSQAGAARRDK